MISIFEVTDLTLDYIVNISELATLLILEQRNLYLRKEIDLLASKSSNGDRRYNLKEKL